MDDDSVRYRFLLCAIINRRFVCLPCLSCHINLNECKHAHHIIVFWSEFKETLQTFTWQNCHVCRCLESQEMWHHITSPFAIYPSLSHHRDFSPSFFVPSLFHHLLINFAPNSFMIIYLCYVFSIYIQILYESNITRWRANKKWMEVNKKNKKPKKIKRKTKYSKTISTDNVYWCKQTDLIELAAITKCLGLAEFFFAFCFEDATIWIFPVPFFSSIFGGKQLLTFAQKEWQ